MPCACAAKTYALRVYVEHDLTVSVVVTNPDGTKATDIVYEHSCGEPAPPPPQTTQPTLPTTKPPAPDGPKTGDESRAGLYIALFCAAGVIVIGCAAYLILAGKRRRKKDACQ
jgi:hypothetical protein